MEKEKAIKIWKELGINKVVMNFNCGGDYMGDTDFEFFDKDGEDFNPTKEQKEDFEYLHDYLNNEVYNKVDFYVNSDGHYQGEFGTVDISLENEYGDDEEDFVYRKNSQSEWSEQENFNVEVELDEEEIEFVKNNVAEINGTYDSGADIFYKRDLILSDRDLELKGSIEQKVHEFCEQFSPDEVEGELEEWFTFTTNFDNHTEEVGINGNSVLVRLSLSVTVIKDEE